MTEPERPQPVAPESLGFERIVYEKAPPRATITLNRPEVLNAFDFKMLRELARACEDASWDDSIRVVVLTGAGRAFCVGADLRSWADELPRQADRVLEVVRRLQGRARPAPRDRQADACADQRDRGGRRQRAADGLRPRRDGGRRVHPARRSRARLGAGGRRDAVADDHGRRPARTRDRADVRGDPRGEGGGVGARQLGSSRGRARRKGGRGRRVRSRGSCRRRRATRSSTSTSGATSPGTRRSTTRATGSRSRWRPTSRGPRSRSSWRSASDGRVWPWPRDSPSDLSRFRPKAAKPL